MYVCVCVSACVYAPACVLHVFIYIFVALQIFVTYVSQIETQKKGLFNVLLINQLKTSY